MPSKLPKCGLLLVLRGTNPLSRTAALKLALELLAGGSPVLVLIQTFPQLISCVPTRFSLGGVRSCHRCVGKDSNVVSDATLTRLGFICFISHLSGNLTRCQVAWCVRAQELLENTHHRCEILPKNRIVLQSARCFILHRPLISVVLYICKPSEPFLGNQTLTKGREWRHFRVA